MTKKSSNQIFGRQLKELRLRENLTVRQFAARCRCAFNFITMIENGHWGCGPGLLGRMAQALNLKGAERVKFMLAGLTTSRLHPLLPEVEAFHPVFLNALGLWLGAQGIKPGELHECTWKPKCSRTQLLKLARCWKRLANLWEKRANSLKPDELADGPELTFRLSSGQLVGVSLARIPLGTAAVV